MSQKDLVSIEFFWQSERTVGDDTQLIGQSMIHAAIQTMQKQLSQWHANVYDEEPVHCS